MHCRQCGRAAPAGSRFCAECGAAMAASPDEPAAAPAALAAAPARRPPSAGHVVVHVAPCSHCGSTSAPVGYFTRPAHIVILVLASIFYFLPGLAYFVTRKDRLVCPNCGARRAGGIPPQALWVQGRLTPGDAGALVLSARDEDAERALTVARHAKRSAVGWWMASAGFAALAVSSGLGFLVGAVACGGIAVYRAVRGSQLEESAEARQKNHQAMRILQLAKLRGGKLSVSDVAASLALPLPDAERALDAMIDGVHVEMEVDDDGRVRYLFPELVGA